MISSVRMCVRVCMSVCVYGGTLHKNIRNENYTMCIVVQKPLWNLCKLRAVNRNVLIKSHKNIYIVRCSCNKSIRFLCSYLVFFLSFFWTQTNTTAKVVKKKIDEIKAKNILITTVGAAAATRKIKNNDSDDDCKCDDCVTTSMCLCVLVYI